MAGDRQDVLAEVLDAVLEAVQQLIDFRRFYVTMYHRPTTKIKYSLVARKDKQTVTRDWMDQERPFMPYAVVPDCIFVDKLPILVPSDFAAWLADKGLRYEAPTTTSIPLCWLGVPLLAKNQVLGVVVVEHTEKEYAFDKRTQNTLATICGRASSVLGRHRLVENLQALNNVGRILTSGIELTEDQILQKIHEQSQSLMDTRDMYIALYDEGARQLSFPLAFRDGKPEKWPTRPYGEKPRGLTEIVIRDKTPLCPPNVQACYDMYGITPEVPPVPRSWLGMPIMSGDKILGVISLQNDEIRNLYEPEDVELLQTMAAQAAIAIDNCRLNESLKATAVERTKQVIGLRRIGEVITSRTDLRKVFESIVQSVKEVTQSHSATIFSYDMGRDKFDDGIRLSSNYEQPVPPSSTGYAAYIAKNQTPKFVNDASREEGVRSTFVATSGIRAFAALPLISGERTVGVMFINYLEPHHFTELERDSLTMFANQAAVALEQARLLHEIEEIQQRTRARERMDLVTRFAGQFIHQLTSFAANSPYWVRQIEHTVADTDLSESVAPYLEALKSDLTKLRDVADQYKQFWRRPASETSDHTWVVLSDLVNEVVMKLMKVMPDLQTRFQIEVICDPSDLSVWATRYDLFAIFYNLTKNALEAMPDGGICQIHCTLLADKPRNIVQITVRDTGNGIPEMLQRKIFDSFFSTKDQLGFGLMETKEAVGSLGGHINVQSEVGNGTQFTVRLPITHRTTE